MVVLLERIETHDESTKHNIVRIKEFPKSKRDEIFDYLLDELKKEFKLYRNDDSSCESPDIKNGEIIVISKENSIRYSWLAYVSTDEAGKEIESLHKVNINMFTDLVLETRKFESEYIGEQMLKEDEFYQMLKHAPTTLPTQKTSSNGNYVFN